MPTEKLEKVMIDSLTKAGRFPSDDAWKELDELTRQAEKKLDQGAVLAAVELMQPHYRLLFHHGSIVEYHETGRRVLKLVERADRESRQFCEELTTKSSEQSFFEQALEIVRAKRVFSIWPALAKQIKRVELKFSRTAAARRELRQAREYDRAVAMLSEEDPKQVAKAVRLLNRIVERYSETHEVADRAAAELKKLKEPNHAENHPPQRSVNE